MYGFVFLSALLAPFAALVLVGLALPLSRAVVLSLTEGSGIGAEYASLFARQVFWTVLGRTFWIAATVAVICSLLAYPLAELLHMAPSRIRPILIALTVVPLWSSAVARTYSWVGVFQRNGVADDVVGALFGWEPMELMFTRPAVIVGMVHVLLPFVALPLYAAIRQYDHRLTRASLSLGAGRMRTFLKVKLPIVAPSVIAGGAAVFIISLGFFITPAVLGGPQSSMISNLIFQQVFGRFDLAQGYAMGIVLLCITLGVLAILALLVRALRTMSE